MSLDVSLAHAWKVLFLERSLCGDGFRLLTYIRCCGNRKSEEINHPCYVYVKVKQFSSKSVEMSLRVASLDYLGIVAARLRRDAVSSRLNEDVISDIIKQVSIAHPYRDQELQNITFFVFWLGLGGVKDTLNRLVFFT